MGRILQERAYPQGDDGHSMTDLWIAVSFKRDISLGDIATIALVVVGLSALGVAWYQLRAVARQTRAGVLLELDERWESGEVLALRRKLEALIQEVQTDAARERVTVAELFPDRLRRLREEAPERYWELFRLCGFFETVAYVSRARYISVSDLEGLLAASIRETGKLFRQHILERQNAPDGIPDLMEHFVWLVDEIERRTCWTFLDTRLISRTSRREISNV